MATHSSIIVPGESQEQRSLVGCRLWGCTESDTTEATWQQQQQLLVGGHLWGSTESDTTEATQQQLQSRLSRFSRVRLCVTPQTAAHQAPPSLGFSRQEYWNRLPTFPKDGQRSIKLPVIYSALQNNVQQDCRNSYQRNKLCKDNFLWRIFSKIFGEEGVQSLNFH